VWIKTSKLRVSVMDAVFGQKVTAKPTTWGERLLMKKKRCTEREVPEQANPGRGCGMKQAYGARRQSKPSRG